MARAFSTNIDRVENQSFPAVGPAGTISCWIQPTFNSGVGSQFVFWDICGVVSGGDLPSFQHFTDNNIYCGFNTSGGGDQRIVVADTGLFTNGVWANWVFTWSSGGNQVLYKNLVSIGTHALTL